MTPTQPTGIWNGNAPRVLRVTAVIVLTIVALAGLDYFLQRLEREEVQRESRDLYLRGSQLLQQNKPGQAVEVLRRSYALAREDSEYELGLIQALTASRKTAEAVPLMNDVLEREPNDGQANLIAARLALKSTGLSAAEPYYHRAIYGTWPENAVAHRVSTRLELIDLLSAAGKEKRLLAELLPLEEEAGNDAGIRKRLGQLYLRAGSPARAAEVFRSMIGRDPKDVDSYLGLGEAELERGRYRQAQRAFLDAFRRQPDLAIRGRVELSSTMTALDPTPRQLTSIEKDRRARRILDLARADLEICDANHPGSDMDERNRLLAAAGESLRNSVPAPVTNEMAEQNLALAQKIWQTRIATCGPGTSPALEPLRLVMERLAQ